MPPAVREVTALVRHTVAYKRENQACRLGSERTLVFYSELET